jgi:hypothetical protein
MLKNYALPQLNNNNLILQLGGEPVHFAQTVREYFNANFPGR